MHCDPSKSSWKFLIKNLGDNCSINKINNIICHALDSAFLPRISGLCIAAVEWQDLATRGCVHIEFCLAELASCVINIQFMVTNTTWCLWLRQNSHCCRLSNTPQWWLYSGVWKMHCNTEYTKQQFPKHPSNNVWSEAMQDVPTLHVQWD